MARQLKKRLLEIDVIKAETRLIHDENKQQRAQLRQKLLEDREAFEKIKLRHQTRQNIVASENEVTIVDSTPSPSIAFFSTRRVESEDHRHIVPIPEGEETVDELEMALAQLLQDEDTWLRQHRKKSLF